MIAECLYLAAYSQNRNKVNVFVLSSVFFSPLLSSSQNCSSHVRRAVVTCFSAGCCGRHGNRPVRYCKRCHVNHHSSEVGAAAETHLYQTSPPPINTRECGAEELVCTVEAVIRYTRSVYIDISQQQRGHMPVVRQNTFLHESVFSHCVSAPL